MTDILLQFNVNGNDNTTLESMIMKYDVEILSEDSLHFSYEAPAVNIVPPVTLVEFCQDCIYASLTCEN